MNDDLQGQWKLRDIDRILSKGDRTEIESLVLRILRDPSVADQVEQLYVARIPVTNGDAEFYARNAYEAAHWLALLSRELPPRSTQGEQL